MEQDKTILERLGIYFIIFLVIGCLLEVGILVYAYFNADKIECNWLWCTFTDIREQNYKSFTDIHSECYVNDVKVNCTEFNAEFPDYASHGWNKINGVCPGWKENITISECIEKLKSSQS